MKILEWLHGPLLDMLSSTLVGGLAVSLMGGVLSVFVVLKRLAFIGQGVSHSAFGGIGVAAVIASMSAAVMPDGVSFFIILGFCIASAVGMAMTSDREAMESDTAIGVFLVASMALGAALVAVSAGRGATSAGSWERALFGSVLGTTWTEARIAVVISAGVLAVMAWRRRPITFWCFDEPASAAFGVPPRGMKLLLIIMLAVATVTAMRLAGVVYATALLVLPGAAALRLSARLGTVFVLSCVFAVTGLLLGVAASIEANLPTGASVVLALTLLFVAACLLASARRRVQRAGPGRSASAEA